MTDSGPSARSLRLRVELVPLPCQGSDHGASAFRCLRRFPEFFLSRVEGVTFRLIDLSLMICVSGYALRRLICLVGLHKRVLTDSYLRLVVLRCTPNSLACACRPWLGVLTLFNSWWLRFASLPAC